MQPLEIRHGAMVRQLDLDGPTLSSMRERLQTLGDCDAISLVERCSKNNALLLLIGPLVESGWPSGTPYAFKPTGVPGYFREQHVNLFPEPKILAHLHWDGEFWVLGSGPRHGIKQCAHRNSFKMVYIVFTLTDMFEKEGHIEI